MKKILTLILAAAVAVQLLVLPVSAKVTSKAEHSWRVVNGLRLADFKDSQKEENITRAEFAQFISGALGITAEGNASSDAALFEKTFYSGMAYDSYGSAAGQSVSGYEDVSEATDAYQAIYALKNLGIMTGDGEGYFHPERNVKYEEVLKTFVVLAAYNADAKIPGSWANGYVKLASDLDIILKGVAIGEEITKYQLCQIFYKLFSVEMMKMIAVVDNNAVYETEEGVSFLNEMIGLYSFTGQLDATANGTIFRPYDVKGNTLSINGNTYADKTQNPIGSYLGREVEAYRTEDGEVVFVTPIDEEEITVIDADEVLGCNDGELSYEINEKTKTIDITDLPVIYNGVAVPTYDDTIFDIYYGSITVTEEANQNVVIIWEYKDLIAKSVNANIMSLFDEVTGHKLVLDEEENTVFIFDSELNRIGIEDISEGAVLSYIENGSYKEVYAGGRKVSGKLTTINPDEMQVVISEVTYKLSEAIVDNNVLPTLNIATEVTAYVNKFGRIFHIDPGKMIGEQTGVLMRVTLDDDENTIVKFYDDYGEFVQYNCTEKVSFTNSHNETSRISASALISAVDGYMGYCVYTLNTDGKLTKLQLPLESKSYQKPGEEKVYQKTFSLSTNSCYRATQYRLGSNMFLNADVDMYSIPTDTADYDNYVKFKLSSLADLEFFSGTAYYKNDDRPVPVAIVVRDRHKNNTAGFSVGDGPKVITKMTQTVREDDKLCYELTLAKCTTGETSTVYSYSENGENPFDNIKTFADTNSHSVNVGDIVMCATKPGTTELSWMKLLYSADMESPAGSEGKKGWLPDMGLIDEDGDGKGDYYSNKFLVIKSVYDAYKASIYSDFYDYADSDTSVSISSIAAQNPFRVGSKGGIGTNPHLTWLDGQFVMLGYAVSYKDGFLKLTTQDLSCESYNPDGTLNVGSYVGINFERYFNLVANYTSLGKVEYYDNGVVVGSGYPEEILTYKNSGKDSSRVLVFGTNFYILINDYRTR